MTEAVIRIEELEFSWPQARGGREFSLRVPAFVARRGEHTLLQGASGSGKSTLLSLIAGLVRPTGGTVEVLDTRLETLPEAQLDAFRASHIGMVFQQFNLVPYLSLLDNVLLPFRFRAGQRIAMSARCDEARNLLECLGLDASLHGARVASLSIGQQQRAAAARALVVRPALVLADEPTSALDAGARDRFIALLFEEAGRRDATVLMVSHDDALPGRFPRAMSIAELAGGHAAC